MLRWKGWFFWQAALPKEYVFMGFPTTAFGRNLYAQFAPFSFPHLSYIDVYFWTQPYFLPCRFDPDLFFLPNPKVKRWIGRSLNGECWSVYFRRIALEEGWRWEFVFRSQWRCWDVWIAAALQAVHGDGLPTPNFGFWRAHRYYVCVIMKI